MRKNTVSQRLNIARGQVEALRDLVERGEDCRKVVEQFSAAESALKSAMDNYLKQHLNNCLSGVDEETKKEMERITQSLVKR